MGEKNNSTFLIKSSSNRSFGTAFCIHKDKKGSFLLTAGHVVDSCGRDHLLVGSYSATLLHISQDDDTLDLALIYVEGLTNSSPLKLSDEKAKEKDEFTIVGYRPHKNDHAKEPLKGSIKKAYSLESKHIRNIYELTINDGDSIEQGYSGSAVVSTVTGLVIAIATDRKRDGKQAFATPAYYLKEIWEDIPNTLFQSSSNINPYKGLKSFGYDDQANYYGREEEAKEIAKTLKNTRLLTLLGASGSGKSSLIYAGVVPLIEEDGVEILTFRPLDNPLKSLASLFIPLLYEDKLEQLRKEKELANDLLNNEITVTQLVEQLLEKKSAKHLYLVIDQFEELFTLTDDKEHRGAFLAKVLELITGTLPVTLLISMRADFLTYLSYSDSLNEVYNNHPNKMLAILKKEKLKAVIEKPALALGVTFVDGLVEKIIEEIEQEAGQLPLLEFALEQLWRDKKGRIISFDTLEQIGSITQSISHYADGVYEKYADIESSIKRIFIHLVSIGKGTEDTKKVVKLEDFRAEDRETITILANERLVVTTENEIEIVHEALIREWKQLKEWIDEYRDFLQWQESIEIDRKFYEERGDLLQGSKLLVAKDFLKSHSEYVLPLDKNFVEESIVRDRLKRRRAKVLYSTFFMVVLLFSVFSFWQWQEVQKQSIIAQDNEKNANAQTLKAKGELEKSEHNIGLAMMEKAKSLTKDKVSLEANLLSYKALTLLKQKYNKTDAFSEAKNILYKNQPFFKQSKTIKGHKDTINSVAFSPNGKRVVSNSYDGTMKIWDTNSGKLLKTIYEHSGSVSFSPDGKRIVSGFYIIKIWDANNGELIIKTLKGHEASIRSVSFSLDGKRIVSGSLDKTIKIWNVDSGALLQTLKGHEKDVLSVSFSPDGKKVVSGSVDKTIKIWDAESGELLQTLTGHKGIVSSVSFSPDGRRIISGSKDKSIKIWNAGSGELLQTLKGHKDSVWSVSFSSDGIRIISSSNDKTIKIWNADSGELLQTLIGHKGGVLSVSFSLDGRSVISGSRDKTIKIWNANSRKLFQILKSYNGYVDSVHRIFFFPDGKMVIVCSVYNSFMDITIKMLDVNNGDLLQTFKNNTSSVTSVAFSPNGKRIVSSLSDGTMKIWDVSSGKLLKTIHEYHGKSVLFSTDNKRIVSWDRIIKIWDADSGELLQTLKGYKSYVTSVSFSPDSKRIVSGLYDKTIKIWNAESGELLQTLTGHKDGVKSVSFSPDGKRVVSGSYDKTIKIWDADTGALLQTLIGHKDGVSNVSFAPDSKRVVSGSYDKTTKIWDADTGALLQTLKGHEGWVTSVLFSPDGKKVVSSSKYKSIKIWNIDELNNKEFIEKKIKELEESLGVRVEGVSLVHIGDE